MNGDAVVSSQPPLVTRRKKDRRAGLFDLIRDLAADWMAQPIRPDLSALLLGRLRQVLPARNIRINELPGGPAIRVGQPVRARDYVAYAVPVADPGRHVVLEASFAGDRVDDWTCQLLEATASLATMIFEAERVARTDGRHESPPRDGAAPLVGSSLVMQGLRERLERVATTDFTVLIEGSIGP